MSGIFEKGRKIFTRTVTYHYVGEVAHADDDAVILNNCSWVADSRRFGDAISNGLNKEAEVEFIGDGVAVMRQAIVDVIPYNHDLPKKSQ